MLHVAPRLPAYRITEPFSIGPHAALQQVESLAQRVEDLLGSEDARPGGGELDGERQLVQAPAELGDHPVRLEPRALAEELDRLRLGQGRDRILDLTADPQELPARDQEL